MRAVSRILTFTLGAVVGGAAVRATVPEPAPDQYQGIRDRNVFGLRPPPAQKVDTPPPAPLPKIILTGITTILGNKRALMKVAPTGAKPGTEAAKEISLILTEGQRDSDVEVLQIDEKAGAVKVNNSGTVMTLTFEKDGAKLPPTAAPGAPGAPPAPGMPNALPMTGVSNNPYLPVSQKIPPRNPRTPTATGVPVVPGLPGGAPAPVGGLPTPTGVNPSPIPAAAGQQQLTPEEQRIIEEFQRQANPATQTVPGLPPVLSVPAGTQPAQTVAPANGFNPQLPAPVPTLVPQ